MDSKSADAKQMQPLREVDLPSNVAVPSSAAKVPLILQSKLKAPTPSASFKRPALSVHALHANEANGKRLRLDISSISADGPSKVVETKAAFNSNVMSRAKSMASLHHKARAAQVQHHAAAYPSSSLSKAPSLASLKTSSASHVSAPTTKTGKRPAWDLKGRMQDNEDALNSIRIQNSDLIKTAEIYNQRLALLESTNNKLSEEVRTKETLTTEKSNKVQLLQGQLDDKIKHCDKLQQDISALQIQLLAAKSDVHAASATNISLQSTIETMSSVQAGLKAQQSATQFELDKCIARNQELEATITSQNNEISGLKANLLQQELKIREDELTRRKLHNTIQELKGNIRVICRVRPLLPSDHGKETRICYSNDDSRSMEISKECSSDEGAKNRGATKYTFDHVFDTTADQKAVFNEVSQLVQSALDGYNVCIFAYGQTGSGKTFTMEGPVDIHCKDRGMIPRTVEQVFDSVKSLEDQGWQYSMEATFLEIYNENIRDLLGNPLDKVKHEIKMCDTKGTDVYVSNLNGVLIASQQQVYQLLSRAQKNRAVAATMCNERSSRSHSVFRLALSGKNVHTMESCQGMLNLVDLAGSERLKESQSEGDRLKETKSINKSLSNLANVITCLANKNEHIPYRNSKLTHLLMNSLGGNSKTLMVVNVSPCEEHYSETINSLRFATTVNQCEIGTAHKKRAVK